MEDLLALYAEPHDPLRPVVCLDEMPLGLTGHVREPLPVEPGRPAKEDHEYVRKGSATLFGALAPGGGLRLLEVRETRTALDLAHFLKRVVEELCAGAERVRLVWDNLNTHARASLYKAFPPEEARRIAAKLELHPTPLHGSWLNMAELEFSVLKRQCLDRRIGSMEELAKAVGAWQEARNRERAGVRWNFGVEEARMKMKKVYPSNEA
jgi:hypothetical protein